MTYLYISTLVALCAQVAAVTFYNAGNASVYIENSTAAYVAPDVVLYDQGRQDIFASGSIIARIVDGFVPGDGLGGTPFQTLSFTHTTDHTRYNESIDYSAWTKEQWDYIVPHTSLVWVPVSRLYGAIMVEGGIRELTFHSHSFNPTWFGMHTTRKITIEALVTFGNGTSMLLEANTSVIIEGRNDAPLLSPLHTSVFWREGNQTSDVGNLISHMDIGDNITNVSGYGVALHPDIVVTDVDDRNLVSLSSTIVSGCEDTDTLALQESSNDTQLLADLVATNMTVRWDASKCELSVSGPTSLDFYQRILRSISYVSSRMYNNSGMVRMVHTYVVDESVSQVNGSLSSEIASVFISILAVNNPPSITVASNDTYHTIEFYSIAPSVDVDAYADLALYDADDEFFRLAEISIVSGFQLGKDTLSLRRSPLYSSAWASNLTITTAANGQHVEIEGIASVYTFQEILQSITLRQLPIGSASPPADRVLVLSLNICDDRSGWQVSQSVCTRANRSLTLHFSAPTPRMYASNATILVRNGTLNATQLTGYVIKVVPPSATCNMSVATSDGSVPLVGIDEVTGLPYTTRDVDVTYENDTQLLDITLRCENGTVDSKQILVEIDTRHPKVILSPQYTPITVDFAHGQGNTVCVDLSSKLALVDPTGRVFPTTSTDTSFDVFAISEDTSADLQTRLSPLRAAADGLFDSEQPLQWRAATYAEKERLGLPARRSLAVCFTGTPTYTADDNATVYINGLSIPPARPFDLSIGIIAWASESLNPSASSGVDAVERLPSTSFAVINVTVRAQVQGCMDPAAAYMPCFANGSFSEFNLTTGASINSSALPCENMCVDADLNGLCDNACGLLLASNDTYECADNYSAYNPSGNFNPAAEVPGECNYPPQTVSITSVAPVALPHFTGPSWALDDIGIQPIEGGLMEAPVVLRIPGTPGAFVRLWRHAYGPVDGNLTAVHLRAIPATNLIQVIDGEFGRFSTAARPAALYELRSAAGPEIALRGEICIQHWEDHELTGNTNMHVIVGVEKYFSDFESALDPSRSTVAAYAGLVFHALATTGQDGAWVCAIFDDNYRLFASVLKHNIAPETPAADNTLSHDMRGEVVVATNASLQLTGLVRYYSEKAVYCPALQYPSLAVSCLAATPDYLVRSCNQSAVYTCLAGLNMSLESRQGACASVAVETAYNCTAACTTYAAIYASNDHCDDIIMLICAANCLRRFELEWPAEDRSLLPSAPFRNRGIRRSAFFDNKLYFVSDRIATDEDQPNGMSLYSMHATTDELRYVPFEGAWRKPVASLDGDVNELLVYGSRLFFVASGYLGRELYLLSAGGTPTVLYDTQNGALSSNAKNVLVYNGILTFFAATTKGDRTDIWLVQDNALSVLVPAALADAVPEYPVPLAAVRTILSHALPTNETEDLPPPAAPFAEFTNVGAALACGVADGWYRGMRQPVFEEYHDPLVRRHLETRIPVDISGYTTAEASASGDPYIWDPYRLLLFAASASGSGSSGRELWAVNMSSGTYLPRQVSLISAIGSNPADFLCVRGALIFTADDHSTAGRELLSYDVASSNVSLLFDRIPGPSSGFDAAMPAELTMYDLRIFYLALDAVNQEVSLYFIELSPDRIPFVEASGWIQGLTSKASNLMVANSKLAFSCEIAGLMSLCAIDASDVSFPLIQPASNSSVSSVLPVALGPDRLLVSMCTASLDPVDDAALEHACDIASVKSQQLTQSSSCVGYTAQNLHPGCLQYTRVNIGTEHCAIRISPPSDTGANAQFGFSVAVDAGTEYTDAVADPTSEWGFMTGLYGTGKHPELLLGPAGMRGVQYNRLGGNVMVVGAPGTASAYIYNRVRNEDTIASHRFLNGTSIIPDCGKDSWRLVQTLTSTQYGSFGAKVAMFNDTAVVSAPSEGVISIYTEQDTRCGASYSGCINKYTLQAELHRATLIATMVAKNPVVVTSNPPSVGQTIDVFADTLLMAWDGVGIDLSAGNSTVWTTLQGLGVPSTLDTGVVSVHTRNGSLWSLHQVLSILDVKDDFMAVYSNEISMFAATDMQFGCSVALDYGILAVGVCGSGQGRGLVQLYTWSPATSLWSTNSKNVHYPLTSSYTMLPVGCPAGFGAAMAIHGPVLVVSAPGYDAATQCNYNASDTPQWASVPGGAVYTYVFDGGTYNIWQVDAQILPPRTRLQSFDGANRTAGSLGAAVAVSTAPFSVLATAVSFTGTVRVSSISSTDMSEWAMINGKKLHHAATLAVTASDPALQSFGHDIDVGGSTAVIGSPAENEGRGAVYVTACAETSCSCPEGAYCTRQCSPGSPSICLPCSLGPCPAGFMQSARCSNTSDRKCVPCSGTSCDTAAPALIPRIEKKPQYKLSFSDAMQQRQRLLELYESLGGSTWKASMRWDIRVSAQLDTCTWAGILCDAAGRITSIRLNNAGLSGFLPTWFGFGFQHVTTLSLAGNMISGPIPVSIATMTHLTACDITNNNFEGELPLEVATLPRLRSLHVGGNAHLNTTAVREIMLGRNVYID